MLTILKTLLLSLGVTQSGVAHRRRAVGNPLILLLLPFAHVILIYLIMVT